MSRVTKRDDRPLPSDAWDWEQPCRSAMPDLAEPLSENWLWSRCVSPVGEQTILEPRVREVLDAYPWEVRPTHGDREHVTAVLEEYPSRRGRSFGPGFDARRGGDSPNAKLSEAAVVAVLEARRGGATLRELAKRFRVSVSTIANVVNRVTWTHVERE